MITMRKKMNIIREKRIQMHMTQKEFARELCHPVSRISKMENGEMTLADACAFCNAFPEEFEIKKLTVQKRIIRKKTGGVERPKRG